MINPELPTFSVATFTKPRVQYQPVLRSIKPGKKSLKYASLKDKPQQYWNRENNYEHSSCMEAALKVDRGRGNRIDFKKNKQ